MRSAPLLCALLLVGCDAFQNELPGLFAAAPRATFELGPKPKQDHHLPRLAAALENKFKPPAMPTLGSGSDCSRVSALAASDADSLQIVLAVVDVRTQTKSLIPRRVSERLESGESTLLSTLLESNLGTDSGEVRRDVPASAVSLTLDDLKRIEHKRYLGVFYVTDYQGPALILRVGKIRREWFAGSLGAKFVLFDTDQQRTICSAELRVTNDVKSAPIRARLQADTRSRLERELGDALRIEAERAAGSVGQQLQWPDSGMKKG
jgi:hypothetical protein